MYGSFLSPHSRNNKIKDVLSSISARSDEFDAIVICGHSTSIIGSIVAWELNKHLIIVYGDRRNPTEKVVGAKHLRYLFIDDHVDTGGTLKRVISSVVGTLVGIYLYYQTPIVTKSFVSKLFDKRFPEIKHLLWSRES